MPSHALNSVAHFFVIRSVKLFLSRNQIDKNEKTGIPVTKHVFADKKRVSYFAKFDPSKKYVKELSHDLIFGLYFGVVAEYFNDDIKRSVKKIVRVKHISCLGSFIDKIVSWA